MRALLFALALVGCSHAQVREHQAYERGIETRCDTLERCQSVLDEIHAAQDACWERGGSCDRYVDIAIRADTRVKAFETVLEQERMQRELAQQKERQAAALAELFDQKELEAEEHRQREAALAAEEAKQQKRIDDTQERKVEYVRLLGLGGRRQKLVDCNALRGDHLACAEMFERMLDVAESDAEKRDLVRVNEDGRRHIYGSASR